MELVFQEKRMVFPSCVLRQCVSQEQTADLIVPDRLPDCERVLEAFGTVTVRSAEAGADSASVVGTVQAGVLFADADGVPHSLQTQLPPGADALGRRADAAMQRAPDGDRRADAQFAQAARTGDGALLHRGVQCGGKMSL